MQYLCFRKLTPLLAGCLETIPGIYIVGLQFQRLLIVCDSQVVFTGIKIGMTTKAICRRRTSVEAEGLVGI